MRFPVDIEKALAVIAQIQSGNDKMPTGGEISDYVSIAKDLGSNASYADVVYSLSKPNGVEVLHYEMNVASKVGSAVRAWNEAPMAVQLSVSKEAVVSNVQENPDKYKTGVEAVSDTMQSGEGIALTGNNKGLFSQGRGQGIGIG
ncbi:MAG: hypothetical protein SFT90_03295 [Rickettsiales bacterium]|nr:hypothetical protein [Rickettsiales bacterium]